jgi:chemotaxis methyl-accepting protein methylase
MLVSQANMADVDFYSFRKLIADRTGIYFSDRKRQMLMQAISEFTQQLQAKNSTDVIQMLNSLSTRSDPWRRLISRLTINETFFFRHFRGIEKQLLPKVILEKMRIRCSIFGRQAVLPGKNLIPLRWFY